jgi:hydrogenase 3 maturation protease
VSRAVIIGVGNRLRGDDAVGCIVVDELAGLAGTALFDAGASPENFIEPVARLRPSRILFVDACDFGGEPGAFRRFDRAEFERLGYGLLSTHTLPLHLTAEMLAQETGAAIELLGIQPQAIEFNQPLSGPLRAALPLAVEFCRGWAASA